MADKNPYQCQYKIHTWNIIMEVNFEIMIFWDSTQIVIGIYSKTTSVTDDSKSWIEKDGDGNGRGLI